MTVRELINVLLDHDMDGEVAVCDRTSWDNMGRLMDEPGQHVDVVLAIGMARLGGFEYRLTNDLVEARRIKDGDFGTMLVVSRFTGG